MIDMFDRPVMWDEDVAGPATPAATAESGGHLRQTVAIEQSVAGVATVARCDGVKLISSAVAGDATAGATGKNHAISRQNDRKLKSVATVAPVAETEGRRLARALAGPPPAFEGAKGFPMSGETSGWADGVAILRRSPALKFYHGKWRRMVRDARSFLSLWGEDAAALGWSTLDIFGVNPDPAHGRYDRLGLVILLDGRAVEALSADSATIGDGRGHTTFYRRLRAQGAVPVWRWCRESFI